MGFGRPALLACLMLASSCGEAATPPTGLAIAGLGEIEQALAAQRGQGCLLNFWATWCPPCVAELPALVDVAREFGPRGGRVLGVSYDLMLPDMGRDATLALVRDFLAARELTLPTLILDESDYAAIDARFDLPGGIPVTLAFDKSGQLVDRHEGQGTRERFAAMMRKALEE